MPGLSSETRVLFSIIAAVAGVIFALFGSGVGKNIIYYLARRGRPPEQPPFHVWAIFFISFLLSVCFGTLAAFGPPTISETADREYLGFVVNIGREPIQGAKVTLDLDNRSQTDFTDSQGNYRFKIPAGSSLIGQISVAAEGFQFYRGNVSIDLNTGRIQAIQLIPIAVTDTPTIRPTYEETKALPTIQDPDGEVSATISCDGIYKASLRRSPGYLNKDHSTDIIVEIDCGQKVEILGENQIADGLTWWNVSWNGYTGWMADRTGSGNVILIFSP